MREVLGGKSRRECPHQPLQGHACFWCLTGMGQARVLLLGGCRGKEPALDRHAEPLECLRLRAAVFIPLLQLGSQGLFM